MSCAFCCTQRAARCSLLYLQPWASSSCKLQGDAGQRWPNTQQPDADFTMIITVSMMLSLCPLFVCPAWLNLVFPYFCVSHPQCRVHSWTQKMHRGYKRCMHHKGEETPLLACRHLASVAKLREGQEEKEAMRC